MSYKCRKNDDDKFWGKYDLDSLNKPLLPKLVAGPALLASVVRWLSQAADAWGWGVRFQPIPLPPPLLGGRAVCAMQPAVRSSRQPAAPWQSRGCYNGSRKKSDDDLVFHFGEQNIFHQPLLNGMDILLSKVEDEKVLIPWFMYRKWADHHRNFSYHYDSISPPQIYSIEFNIRAGLCCYIVLASVPAHDFCGSFSLHRCVIGRSPMTCSRFWTWN